jgi:hypothetical protein
MGRQLGHLSILHGAHRYCTPPSPPFLDDLDEQGQQAYFRYYDPRVLRRFLPSFLAEEAGGFFGPIQRFYLEGDTASDLLVLALDQGELKKLSTKVQVTGDK